MADVRSQPSGPVAENGHLIDQSAPLAERVLRYAARISAHADLVASQNPGVPVYRGWGFVPSGLKTRNQWDDEYRRVVSGTNTAGILVWPEIMEVRDDDGKPTGFEDVRCRSVRLYRRDQTSAYEPTAREKAQRLFFDIFVRPCSRERYGWWSDEGWRCVWNALSKSQARSHVHGTSVYGVYGGLQSRFVAVDLDLHGGDEEVFLEQLEILLNEWGGKDGWHLQVSDQNAGGVHLLKVVPLTSLTDLRASLRAGLQLLDRKYPEQAHKAQAAGMKPLGDVEIFPNPKQVFRLPLCRGRSMLLDRPLRLIENARARNGTVQDVEGYIKWLETTPDAVCPLHRLDARSE